MKPSPFILSGALVAVAAAAWLALRKEETPPPPQNPAALHEGTMSLKTDEADIFRRAFWRKPDSTDIILHAERREWTKDSTPGIAFWQWFLAVEPGPALTKWLRQDNAFGVRPAKSAVISGSPSWFPGDMADYEIHTGGTGGDLVLLFSRDGKTLFATASGKGFTPGAPEPAGPASSAAAPATAGRLPATPPPNPPNSPRP